MKAIPRSEVVNLRCNEKMEERRALLHSVKAEYAKAADELATLRSEVVKSIHGESAFSKELLASLIAEAETKCAALQQDCEAAQRACDEGQTMLESLNAQYDELISWAELYDSAGIAAKKMVVSCLIKRIDVFRDYKLHIEFNIDLEQFGAGLDAVPESTD